MGIRGGAPQKICEAAQFYIPTHPASGPAGRKYQLPGRISYHSLQHNPTHRIDINFYIVRPMIRSGLAGQKHTDSHAGHDRHQTLLDRRAPRSGGRTNESKPFETPASIISNRIFNSFDVSVFSIPLHCPGFEALGDTLLFNRLYIFCRSAFSL